MSSLPRVFISYAHESDAHAEAVRDLWIFLRANGVDAQIDRVAAQERQGWTLWMEKQVASADHVLVNATRAGADADPDEGRGVQYEARLIRNRFLREPVRPEPGPARGAARLGNLAVAVGDPATAGQHYRATLGIVEWLAAADPRNAQVRNDLAYFRRQVADLHGPHDPA